MKYLLSIFCIAASSLLMSGQATDSVSVAAGAPSHAPGVAASAAGIDTAIESVPSVKPGESASTVMTVSEYLLKADSAYSVDNFVEAEGLYLKALHKGGSSSELFYNIGNTYYRQGNLGKAIVYYERALKLDPTNSDARTNLEFVNSKITDKQIDSGSYLDSIWEGTVGMFRADTWAIIALAFFALFLGLVAAYLFSSAIIVKKSSFFGGLIVFAVTVFAVIISFSAANRINDHSDAVILPPSAQLSTSPRVARNQSEQAFLLHEGTKVEIVDSISTPAEGKWYEVMVGHGERAWIKSTEVERI